MKIKQPWLISTSQWTEKLLTDLLYNINSNTKKIWLHGLLWTTIGEVIYHLLIYYFHKTDPFLFIHSRQNSSTSILHWYISDRNSFVNDPAPPSQPPLYSPCLRRGQGSPRSRSGICAVGGQELSQTLVHVTHRLTTQERTRMKGTPVLAFSPPPRASATQPLPKDACRTAPPLLVVGLLSSPSPSYRHSSHITPGNEENKD